jgi:glutathione S-transferase
VQNLLWRYIENDVEECTFKLNDAHFQEFVPAKEQLNYLRHKERKFGRACLQQWHDQQPQLLAELTQRLVPFEQMLETRPFLLDQRPRFVDLDLFGMLANFLYSGHYQLPAAHPQIRKWYERVKALTHSA